MLAQGIPRAFLAVAAVLFAASAALTVAACGAMSAMRGMAMPGGWTLSMMWMRMPGQSWPGVAAAFLAMWSTMMVAMMLPTLAPMLARYRRCIAGATALRVDALTAVAAGAYFAVWTAAGVGVFAAGAAAAWVALHSPMVARAVPTLIGAVALAAGALQFSVWKTRHLACCRGAVAVAAGPDVRSAWRHGVRLGVHCVHCCAGMTVALVAAGMMDLAVMGLAAAAISVERLAPGGARAARAVGAVLMIAGAFAIGHAAVSQ